MRQFIIAKTIFNIGIKNIILFGIYKILKYTKFYYFYMPQRKIHFEGFSKISSPIQTIDNKWFLNSKEKYIAFMDDIENKKLYWFSRFKCKINNPPDWFFDPYKKINYKFLNRHWSLINESNVNDLKNIWEISRWNWATLIARSWLITGEKFHINCLNKWMKNWCEKNPSNFGFNWICGQEVSIRLINALITWKLINKEKFNKESFNIENFVLIHLERLSQTILYAESQNNNHWVSEASALYIGGRWLKNFTDKKIIGNFYEKKGRKHLERSINKLIMNDGSFSQYSINYHRFLVDTLVQVELWRQYLNAEPFSEKFYSKCKLATLWLIKFVNSKTGHCPNIGANDGGFCFQLHNLDYLNFKPCTQLSCIVFLKKFIYEDGPWDEPLFWLSINKNKYSRLELAKKNNEILFEGGYGILGYDPYFLAVLRIPRYRFRPSQADPLHFDLWINGLNILRDGGSFSYSKKNKYLNYFSGIRSHNTAQFDNKEPMYRISRFLWGDWLKAKKNKILINNNKEKLIETGYKFKYGSHIRKISVSDDYKKVSIIDNLSEFPKTVTIRWRLIPTKWELDGFSLKSKFINLNFITNTYIKDFKLTSGFESLFYNEISKVPVLEITLENSPCELKTVITNNFI